MLQSKRLSFAKDVYTPEMIQRAALFFVDYFSIQLEEENELVICTIIFDEKIKKDSIHMLMNAFLKTIIELSL